MSSGPRLSIGLPVFNGGRFFIPALESLLAQTFGDFELIISDNASTDETEATCRAYAARDARIKYVRQPNNIGANPNYNAVRRLARGVYFKWASANDLCEPTFLAECIDALDRRADLTLAYSETRLIDEDDAFVEDYAESLRANGDDPIQRLIDILDTMWLNNAFNGVFRASALHQAGDMKRYFGSDLPLMAAVALRGPYHRVPAVLFKRRIGPSSHTKLSRKAGTAAHHYFDEDHILLKLYADYFSVIARSQLSLPQKLAGAREVLKRAYWRREPIGGELFEILKAQFRPLAQREA